MRLWIKMMIIYGRCIRVSRRVHPKAQQAFDLHQLIWFGFLLQVSIRTPRSVCRAAESPLAPHRARGCASPQTPCEPQPPAAAQRWRAQLALCAPRTPVQDRRALRIARCLVASSPSPVRIREVAPPRNRPLAAVTLRSWYKPSARIETACRRPPRQCSVTATD